MHELSATEDGSLIAAVARGSEDALREVYRRYAGAVYGLARRVTSDETLAEDVTQRVFLEMWQQADRFDPARGGLRPYLLARSHRRAVDVVRSEQARRNRERAESRRPPAAPDDVESTVATRLLGRRVRAALSQLTDGEREAILLTYFEGQSYRAAAATLAQPEGTVKSRIRSGLRRLRDHLEAEGAQL